MGGLVKSIFGGTDRSAQTQQIQQNTQDRALFQRLADQARTDVTALTGAGDENRNMAYQQVLNLLSGTIPQRMQAQQSGNVGAQQQLIGSLPMIQAALMGQPLNFASMQPTQIAYNTNFARQTLPQFRTSAQALQPATQPAPTPQPDLSSMLYSGFGGE